MIHQFARIITKKEAINKYGKLGFREHAEAVFFKCDTKEEAFELIKPFNYKKHIKFRYFGTVENENVKLNEIIDMGAIDTIG